MQEIITPTGIRTPNPQPVASRYTDYQLSRPHFVVRSNLKCIDDERKPVVFEKLNVRTLHRGRHGTRSSDWSL